MRVTIFAVVLVAMVPVSCPCFAAETQIVMKNFDFSPMDVTIAAGDTVVWTNKDGEPHTVASADGVFHSPALDEGDSFRFTFDHPGVYKYICSIHPKMRATVTVK